VLYDDVVATKTRKKLTAAEKARVRLLAQEAKAERLVRLVEQRADAIAQVRECMEGAADYGLGPERLRNQADQWEGLALREINAGRIPSRVCRCLPASAYEQKVCGRYADGR